MSVEITRPGKNTLVIETPVMPASGVFGFGDVYRDLIEVDRLGAIVTNPVTFLPSGSCDRHARDRAGFGRAAAHRLNRIPALTRSSTSIATHGKCCPCRSSCMWSPPRSTISRAARPCLDREESIAAIRSRLHDDIGWKSERFVKAVTSLTEKPTLVRLPLQDSVASLDQIARASADAGAGAVVAGAPPRGTTRDAVTGRLIGGRVYGPLVRPLALRLVGQLAGGSMFR